MADERVVSDIVTKFLLNTCRLRPQLGRHVVQAACCCAQLATEHPFNDTEADNIPLVTGSVAEFYIEPMLAHVGDIHVMFHHSTELAIPRGHPSPTQLPAEFHNCVKVFEIVDSHLPGYVCLELRYRLTQSVDDGTYSYYEYDRGRYLGNPYSGDNTAAIHGPAMLTDMSQSHTSLLSVDVVPCVRCLSWPPQAADWPTRHRHYDWPDSATVDRVVSNGCDMVPVAHRQCREHEWMGKRQWRLSFSRAEIVLISSWMPVQQIVYHMLRVFVKCELLKHSDFSEALTNYHIKTLMMWACELRSSSFWTDDLNLIRICVKLLHTLYVWLTDVRCKHYFINNCNLIDTSFSMEMNPSLLMSVDDAWLSTWFVNNYIRKSSAFCPDNLSSLFSDVSTNTKLEKAVSAVVNYILDIAPLDSMFVLHMGEIYISNDVYRFSLTARSCVCWMVELAKTDTYLPLYFSAVAFLHVARKIARTGLTDELMDVLATTTGQLVSYSSQCSSQLSLSKATKLMKLVANSSRSTMQSIETELCNATDLNTSKLVELLQRSAVEHLTTYRQLLARDFASVVTIATEDFEALYAYKREEYQRCLQLSTQNVRTLLYGDRPRMTDVTTFPEFIQLLDDDIVSLTALMLILNPECRVCSNDFNISQMTLSLYLMTRCQLKLRHSVTSLAHTLDYVKLAQRIYPADRTLDQLTLKLTRARIAVSLYRRVLRPYDTK